MPDYSLLNFSYRAIMKQNLLVYTSLLLAMVLWSLSFIWYKQVFQYLNPITVVFFRLAIVSVLLLFVTKTMGLLQKIKRKDLSLFILGTFFEPFLYFLGESYGVNLVAPSIAAVIIATIPLLSPVAGAWFFREKFSSVNAMGFTVSVIGVSLVVLAEEAIGSVSVKGVASLFLAVFAAIGYSAVVKKLTGKYSPLSIVTWQSSIGLVFFAPLFFIFDFPHLSGVIFTPEVIYPLLKLAVFASGFAYIFFTYGIKRVGMSRANVFANLIPVFTAVFSWYFLNEMLSGLKVAGICLVVAGLFLSQQKPGMNLF